MILRPGGQRFYGALDTTLGRFMTNSTVARAAERGVDDPPDPLASKIRFTNRVLKIAHSSTFNAALKGIPRLTSNIYPAYAWVDFERDVFFIGGMHRFPGLLLFLFHGTNWRMPPQLDDDHWSRRIRQFAMRVSKSDSLEELDKSALAHMRMLKTVFLLPVIPAKEHVWFCYCGGREDDPLLPKGPMMFTEAARIWNSCQARLMRLPFPTPPPWFRSFAVDLQEELKGAEAFSNQLRAFFDEIGHRRVEIKIVADMMKDSFHRRCLENLSGVAHATKYKR
ncbi:hypothetical protein DL770_007340 [Monosporascus sp. CRB-9-2]|nr:hypothetical protein DL770_007340 [Monosporascus sp. CRB-9-2]